MDKQIRIYDFTQPEIDHLIAMCNFNEDERTFFDLRNKYYTLERVAEDMNISTATAYRLNKRVKAKILKVM